MTKLKLTKIKETGDALAPDKKTGDFVAFGKFYDLTYKSEKPKMFLKVPFLVKKGEKALFPATANVKLSRKVIEEVDKK